MERELKNKVIVITGGAGGIGYEICDKYLEEGAKTVIIIDIDETRGEQVRTMLTAKHGDKIIFIPGDVVTDLEKIFKIIVDSVKTVDVLVQAAGISDVTKPKRMVDIHLAAVIDWCLKFEEIMRTDRGNGIGGTMVLISSVFGFRLIPFMTVYQATKFGVLGFAESMGHSRNYKKTGIRVVALCPGFTETNLSLPLLNPKFQESLKQDFISYINEQVWQKASDVGDAAVEVFKRGDSGSVWVIEGGKLMERKSES